MVSAFHFPSFITDKHGVQHVLCYGSAQTLSPIVLETLFVLVKKNMKAIYEASGYPWSDRKKRKEMSHVDSKYVIVYKRNELEPEPSRQECIGFIHYQVTEPDDEYCLYWQVLSLLQALPFYLLFLFLVSSLEIQLAPEYQGHGLGTSLMLLLESLAVYYERPRILLTVQSQNSVAAQFYSKLGYQLDDSSPSQCHQVASYEILCKYI